MNGIRKLAFHAARYNRQKYLDSDVRSRPLQSVRRAFFSYRTVVILHREQPHPRKPYRGIQRTSSKDSPARIFVVARQQRAVPLYAEKFFGIQRYSSLCEAGRRSRVTPLKLPDWWQPQKRGSDARQRQIPESTGIISNSPRKRISALSRCFVRLDWSIIGANLSSKESSTRSSSLSNATEDIVQIIQFPCFEFFNLWSYIVKQLNWFWSIKHEVRQSFYWF